MDESGGSKGSIYIIASNVVFVLTGYAIYFGLARMLGPSLYGDYGVVVSLVSTINTVLAISMQQAVSKFVSEDTSQAVSVRNTALKLQGLIVLVVFSVYMLLSGFIANVFNDPSLVLFLQVSAFIIPLQGLYSVCLGYFNGLQEFGKQALVSVVYYIAKLILVLSLVYLGLSLFGAVSGLVLSALVALVVAVIYAGLKRTDVGFNTRVLLSFCYPVALFALMLNLVLTVDIFFLKALLPVSTASVEVGFYTAALYIARIPYFIADAIAVVVFPIVSAKVALSHFHETRRYVRKTLLCLLLFLTVTTALILLSSGMLIELFYTSAYSEAAQPLLYLVFGLAGFSVFAVMTSVISGSGRPKVSFMISLLMVVLQVLFLVTLIPQYGLIGAAMATTSAMLFGALLSLAYAATKGFL